MDKTLTKLLQVLEDKQVHEREDLVRRTVLSYNSVRNHLAALTERGIVRRHVSAPRAAYSITGTGILRLYDLTHPR